MFIYTISDIIGAAMAVLLLAAWLCVSATRWVKAWRCKHDGAIYENRACHAICCQCDKDLGFIGAVREQRAAQAAAKTQEGERT